jgi:hypothetical protein
MDMDMVSGVLSSTAGTSGCNGCWGLTEGRRFFLGRLMFFEKLVRVMAIRSYEIIEITFQKLACGSTALWDIQESRIHAAEFPWLWLSEPAS